MRKQIYWAMTERAIGRANKILAVSSRTEKDLIAQLGIDARKITVEYIDADEIYKKNIPKKTISAVLKKYRLKPGYIYTGGGLEVRKNTASVVHAYKYLLEKNSHEHFLKDFPKLVISGKLMPQLAPLITDVTKLIEELNLTQHIQILDFVPQKDLPALYNQAVMFVYPSHYEGFGIPVLEAMSAGTAVITAKNSSLPEVGLDSVLYCDSNDVSDVAMVMKNVLLNAELRATLIRRGKERAQYFSWEKFNNKILNVIKNL
jgi:glycosyltransferase involved in cell wall biosynthesis